MKVFQRNYQKLVLVVLGVFSLGQIFANGDPVVYYSALALTCTPEPRRIPEIQLLSEDLFIKAGCPLSHVKVKYVLQNTSDKKFDRIDYGFPVDWFGDGEAKIGDANFCLMDEQEFGWRDSYVQSVKFQIDEKDLSWQCSKDTLLRPGIHEQLKEITDEGEQNRLIERQIGYCKEQKVSNIYRKWYYTSFDFAPNQTRILTVEYKIASRYMVSVDEAYSVFAESVSFLYCDNITPTYPLGRCELAYDFKPAAYWGNGKADEMRVMLNLPSEENGIKISGLNMSRESSSLRTYSATDFDFNEAEPLRVEYRTEVRKSEDLAVLQQKRLSLDQYKVWANGKDIQNMKDNDLSTVGQILPDEKGRYELWIQTDGTVDVCGLLIYQGDCSNRERYLETAHWKSIFIKSESEGRTDECTFSCHSKKASSMSLQDLTDVAEKFYFAPFGGEGYRVYRPKEIILRITDLEVKENEPLFVSDIQLIGSGRRAPQLSDVPDTFVYLHDAPKVSSIQIDRTPVVTPRKYESSTEPVEERKIPIWIYLVGVVVLLALWKLWRTPRS